jgi:NitT/TauT family transport system substrate-binding protein
VLLRSWAQVIEAFISGQVNVIHLLSPMTVWARYGSKVPAKVVAWNHVGGSGLTVAPGITEVKQLGGKTVAIPFWYSIHNVVLQQMLNDNGLTPVSKPASAAGANEVNLLVLPPSDMPPALASKRIAGYIVAEPFNALAENLKVGRVQRFTGDVWRNHACCVVFMHEHDLNNRPEWSQKVVNAIVKAQQWTRDHRAEAAALLSKAGPNKYTPHEPAVLTKVLAPAAEDRAGYIASGAIQHQQWDEKRIDFQPYPFPSYTEELVKRLKGTLIEGDNGFLAGLDPAQSPATWSTTASCATPSLQWAARRPSALPTTSSAARSSRSDAQHVVHAGLGWPGCWPVAVVVGGCACSARPTACRRAFRRRPPWPAWSSCWGRARCTGISGSASSASWSGCCWRC